MIYWILACFAAYFIKGLCGFANTLVFNGIAGLGVPMSEITPAEVILSYPANAIMAFKERKSINWKNTVVLALLIIAGGIPGALFLKNADGGMIKAVCGVVIIILAMEMLLRDFTHKKYRNTKVGMTIFGLTCGVMCGLYGVGALLGAYLTRVSEDTHEFKGTLNMVFVFENTFRIANYIFLGLISVDSFIRSLSLIPVMVAGILSGMAVSKCVTEKVAKRIVILVLIVCGAGLLVNNI